MKKEQLAVKRVALSALGNLTILIPLESGIHQSIHSVLDHVS